MLFGAVHVIFNAVDQDGDVLYVLPTVHDAILQFSVHDRREALPVLSSPYILPDGYRRAAPAIRPGTNRKAQTVHHQWRLVSP